MLLLVKNAVINAGGNLLGAVLNNVDIRLDQYYQYQTNYYSYHEEDGKKPGGAKQPKSVTPPLAVAGRSSQPGTRDEY